MTDRVKKRLKALHEMKNEAFFYERMTLLEEAYRQYGDESPGRRYAHAFAYLLEHMTVVLYPGEILAGAVKEIIPNEQEECVFSALVSRPGNRNRFEWAFSFDSLRIKEDDPCGIKYNPEWFTSNGHLTPHYESLLKKGIGGIREEIQEKLKGALSQSQRDFYENGIICCDAVEKYAQRVAAHARLRAAQSAGSSEEEDYRTVAAVLERVPMQPANSFHEALQSIWLIHMILSNVCGARDYAFGPMGRYLFPYYQTDRERGVLTDARALELIESFFIKINEIIGYCVYNYNPKRSLCNHSVQYVYVSGHDDAGKDVTNPLSYLLLKAHEELKLQQPTLYIHYNEDIDPQFLCRAVEVVKQGRGDPAFYNDRVVIHALETLGIPHEDAVHFSHFGCNNISLAGMEDEVREIWNNLPKFLELALNGGRCMQRGELLTFEAPTEFHSIDEVCDALFAHYRYTLERALDTVRYVDRRVCEEKEFSFESLFTPFCLAHGVDLTRGTKYKHCNVHASGLSTTGDSLYALDRLVFQEKRYTLKEFCDILKNNWEGYETLRLEIKRKFPKYGNDDDVCDAYTVRLAKRFSEETLRYSPMKGAPMDRLLFPVYFSLDFSGPMGKCVSASADGRKSGEVISENQSPTYGTERGGPTAMLRSVSKLPFQYTPGGCLNVKLQSTFVQGEKGTQTLMDLIMGYFKDGGLHMQIMVTDKKVLEDAVVHPERHRDLLVRITGYSAYFVALSPHEQQQIINRTAFA